MKKNPKPLIYFTLGIALIALSNAILRSTPDQTDLVVWGFVGIIGNICVFVVTPIHIYYWFKNKKAKGKQTGNET